MNEPSLTRYLNYRGDRRGASFPRGVVGPTTTGEPLTPIDATYDPETDMTRVSFSVLALGGAR